MTNVETKKSSYLLDIVNQLKEEAKLDYDKCSISLKEQCSLEDFVLQECSVRLHSMTYGEITEDNKALIEFAKLNNAYSEQVLIDGGFFNEIE